MSLFLFLTVTFICFSSCHFFLFSAVTFFVFNCHFILFQLFASLVNSVLTSVLIQQVYFVLIVNINFVALLKGLVIKDKMLRYFNEKFIFINNKEVYVFIIKFGDYRWKSSDIFFSWNFVIFIKQGEGGREKIIVVNVAGVCVCVCVGGVTLCARAQGRKCVLRRGVRVIQTLTPFLLRKTPVGVARPGPGSAGKVVVKASPLTSLLCFANPFCALAPLRKAQHTLYRLCCRKPLCALAPLRKAQHTPLRPCALAQSVTPLTPHVTPLRKV